MKQLACIYALSRQACMATSFQQSREHMKLLTLQFFPLFPLGRILYLFFTFLYYNLEAVIYSAAKLISQRLWLSELGVQPCGSVHP